MKLQWNYMTWSPGYWCSCSFSCPSPSGWLSCSVAFCSKFSFLPLLLVKIKISIWLQCRWQFLLVLMCFRFSMAGINHRKWHQFAYRIKHVCICEKSICKIIIIKSYNQHSILSLSLTGPLVKIKVSLKLWWSHIRWEKGPKKCKAT